MQCIYYNGKNCLALPATSGLHFEPSEIDRKDYCVSGSFESCPRLRVFEDYLRAIHGATQQKQKS
jgi:hypothetical protein